MKLRSVVSGFAALAFVAIPAMAVTSVQDPWNTGSTQDELNLFEIYNAIYGTDFSSTNGASTGDGSTGGMDDLQVIPDEIFSFSDLDAAAVFAARYASRDQEFGYYSETDGDPTYVTLFESNLVPSHQLNQLLAPSGNDVYPLIGVIPVGDSPVGFFDRSHRPDESLSLLWHSEEDRNADGLDHMVAYYALLFNEDTQAWEVDTNTILIAFEDHYNLTPDFDYNDMVVEVNFPGGFTPNDPGDPIPEPATTALLLMGLAGVAARKRFMA
jgi:hypothetical protein